MYFVLTKLSTRARVYGILKPESLLYLATCEALIFKTGKRSNNHFALYLRLGETGAGKSSMLNLILGEEILPFSVLSTTSTVCELKYGRQKRIKVHYKKEGKAPEIKYLTEYSPYIDQISEFVHVKSASLREKASSYKKVELFWPHRLLQVRYSDDHASNHTLVDMM